MTCQTFYPHILFYNSSGDTYSIVLFTLFIPLNLVKHCNTSDFLCHSCAQLWRSDVATRRPYTDSSIFLSLSVCPLPSPLFVGMAWMWREPHTNRWWIWSELEKGSSSSPSSPSPSQRLTAWTQETTAHPSPATTTATSRPCPSLCPPINMWSRMARSLWWVWHTGTFTSTLIHFLFNKKSHRWQLLRAKAHWAISIFLRRSDLPISMVRIPN